MTDQPANRLKILRSILGDYEAFFTDVFLQSNYRDISLQGYPLSHLGLRTTTKDEYVTFREALKPFCSGWVENLHNGRPIAKLLLAEPLPLPHGFKVSLIELMSPKPDRSYPTGLEHLGVVIGPKLELFAERHHGALSGRQDQGPYCQPYFITFPNDHRIKFYDIGLQEVVEKEGGIFRKD